jgi:hypothetical protein
MPLNTACDWRSRPWVRGAVVLLWLLTGSWSAAQDLAQEAGPARSVFDQLDLLVDVRHEIVTQYVEAPDQQAMTEAAFRAMI